MTEKTPRSGKDFVQLAQTSEKVANIRDGKGSHVIIEFEDGSSVSIPVHGNKQLGRGILHKITKAFRIAGVISLLLLAFWLFSS